MGEWFKGFARFMGAISAIGFLIWIAQWMGAMPRDATDSPSARSGLSLHSDHETGCQYLSGLVGITPRLNGSGQHMGCKP